MNHKHFQRIYQEEPEKYDALVSFEDYRGKLLPAIEDITPLEQLSVAEFGAGTGRLTRLLSLRAKKVFAADISVSMLQVAHKSLSQTGTENWYLFTADHRNMPIPSNSVELAIAGWTFGYFVDEKPKEWLPSINKAISEVRRILKPDGICIIIETLGTFQRFPSPPNQHLAHYYNWLEKSYNFNKFWIRTDYQFNNLIEAEELIGFFFGEHLARKVTENNSLIVPECTGIWWRNW